MPMGATLVRNHTIAIARKADQKAAPQGVRDAIVTTQAAFQMRVMLIVLAAVGMVLNMSEVQFV